LGSGGGLKGQTVLAKSTFEAFREHVMLLTTLLGYQRLNAPPQLVSVSALTCADDAQEKVCPCHICEHDGSDGPKSRRSVTAGS